jgi:4-amino-4-deoxychorismate lyase
VQAIEEGIEGIARVEQRPISLAEAKAATEVFFVDSTLPVMPVVGWDVMLIADGTAGLAALQVRVMLQQDMQPRPGSDQHTEVPYGFMTGMLD